MLPLPAFAGHHRLDGEPGVGRSQVTVASRSAGGSTGGAFKGLSIYAVAQDLKNGVLDPSGIKVNVFEHEGQLVAENNRSLAALSLAGLEPTNINILDNVPGDVLARLGEEPLVSGELPSSMTAVTPSQEDLRIGDIIQTPGG